MSNFWNQQLAEASQMLSEVQAAIIATSKNQSYRIGDVWYTRADLPALRVLESKLLTRVARLTKGAAPRVTYGDMSGD